MRIAVHDYAGHPFQFQLTRALARRGHVARHFFYADDVGPKGAETAGDDPPTYSAQRLSVVGYSKSNFLRRLAGDVRYGAAAAAAIAAFEPDVVISGNTPLDAQAQIVRSTHQAGAAFVFWMQDVFSLAVSRLLGRRWLGAGALVAARYQRLERRLLRTSDAVVLISEDFERPLRRFGLAPGKVFVIPNWGALDEIPVTGKASAWAAAHGLADKFVFLYSGTLALKHNPDLLWMLARAFGDDADVVVALAAAGVSAEALRRRQESEPLSNLVFLPLQPMADFPALLGAADVLVALLENDAGAFSAPSKILSYLCAGRPILLSAPRANAAARMVERAGAGIAVAADDAAGFLAAARRLRADAAWRGELGDAARRYAEATFDIEAIADRFEAVFATVRPG